MAFNIMVAAIGVLGVTAIALDKWRKRIVQKQRDNAD